MVASVELSEEAQTTSVRLHLWRPRVVLILIRYPLIPIMADKPNLGVRAVRSGGGARATATTALSGTALPAVGAEWKLFD